MPLYTWRLSSTFLKLKVIQLANFRWHRNITDVCILILPTISKRKRIQGFPGNDRACASSRYQAVSLLPRGLGTKLGSVLTTNVFQTNLCQLLFRALKVVFVTTLPPAHLLTNLIINRLLDANAVRKWGKSLIPRTVNIEHSQNGLCAKGSYKTKNSISLDSRFVDFENTG